VERCCHSDHSDAASPPHRFEYPVVFVAERLKSRWSDLMDPSRTPSLRTLPPKRFLVLEDIWIVSTYLRLREAGFDVAIDAAPRRNAINVVCSPRTLLDSPHHDSVVVAIRADRARPSWGDLTLVQSPLNLERSTDWLIDHWPQPNIIPRNPERGDRLQRVGIIGPRTSIAPELQSARFRSRLEELGLDLVIRDDGSAWNDYSDLDVQLAYRTGPLFWLRCKPATKIVQSWIAGCPAITGVEPCFRTIGRPGLDYLEATSGDQIVEHLRMLLERPDAYRSLIERGFSRAHAHDEQSVLRQWVAFLEGPATEVLRQRTLRTAPGRRRWSTRTAVLTSIIRHRLMLEWVKVHFRVRQAALQH
jgi:hypothetical protein